MINLNWINLYNNSLKYLNIVESFYAHYTAFLNFINLWEVARSVQQALCVIVYIFFNEIEIIYHLITILCRYADRAQIRVQIHWNI